MVADTLSFEVCAWLVTYTLHSTLLIVAAWVGGGVLPKLAWFRDSAALVRERLWKLALLGGFFTSSAAVLLDHGGWSTRWILSAAGASESRSAPMLEASVPPVDESTSDAAGSASIEAAELAAIEAALARESAGAGARRATTGAGAPGTTTGAGAPGTNRPDRAASSPKPARARSPRIVDPLPRATPESIASAAGEASVAAGWVRALVLLWIAGVAVGAMAWIGEWRMLFRRLRGRALLTHGRAIEVLRSLQRASGRGRGVAVSVNAGLAGPVTLGFWKREICLPTRALSQLRDDELQALLAHELAHAVRRDPAWLALCRSIEILFFFQPLNRLARRRLQDQAEYLCDDWAIVHVGERLPLASCLTEIATWIVGERGALPAPAMVVRGSRLTYRVERLLCDDHRPERSREQRGLWVGAGLGLAWVALCAPSVSARVEERASPEAREVEPIALASAPVALDPTVEAVPLLALDALLLESDVQALEQEFAELDALAARRRAPQTVRDEIDRLRARLTSLRVTRQALESALDAEIRASVPAATLENTLSSDDSVNKDLP